MGSVRTPFIKTVLRGVSGTFTCSTVTRFFSRVSTASGIMASRTICVATAVEPLIMASLSTRTGVDIRSCDR